MSDLAASSALPLFHNHIVPLDPVRHASLKLDRDSGYGYSAGAEVIPIGIGEFVAAAQHYPILFTSPPEPVAVVLLGATKGRNLFVDQQGAWMPGAYVPALVRVFPFVMIDEAGGMRRTLGIEADAACLSPTKGQALFADGKPTAALNDAMALCQLCQAHLQSSAAFAAALEEAGVLQPKEATIEIATGGTVQITGFPAVDPDKVAALPDQVFLEWRRRDWLVPLYAHLFSTAKWIPFTDLVISSLATRQ
jgi:hypothetical protein